MHGVMYEVYALTMVFINFLLMSFSYGGPVLKGDVFLDLQPFTSVDASDATYMTIAVTSSLTFFCALLAVFSIIVNLVHLTSGQKPGAKMTNLFTCLAALFFSILVFTYAYLYFTITCTNANGCIDIFPYLTQSYIRTNTIVSMSLVAVLIWFLLPLYACGALASSFVVKTEETPSAVSMEKGPAPQSSTDYSHVIRSRSKR